MEGRKVVAGCEGYGGGGSGGGRGRRDNGGRRRSPLRRAGRGERKEIREKRREKRKKKRSLKVGPETNGVNCLLSHICHLGLTVGQIGQIGRAHV